MRGDGRVKQTRTRIGPSLDLARVCERKCAYCSGPLNPEQLTYCKRKCFLEAEKKKTWMRRSAKMATTGETTDGA